MAQTNLLAGLANTRIRTLVILVGVVLAVILLITLTRSKNEPEDALTKQGSQAIAVPASIRATPGNVVSEKYRELQLAENERRAQEAAQKKTSAIPTIVGAIGDASQDKNLADINALEEQLRQQGRAGRGLDLGAGAGGFAGGDFAGGLGGGLDGALGGPGGLGAGGLGADGAFGKSARDRAREEQEARMRAERERLERIRLEKERQAELERLRRLAEQQRKEYLEAVQKTQAQMKAYASLAYNEWSKFPEQKWVSGAWHAKDSDRYQPEGVITTSGGASTASVSSAKGAIEKQSATSRFARDVKAAKQKVYIKAGTILFGVLDTAVNSDENGPVLATVVGGKYQGSKLIGNFTHQQFQESVLLQFSQMTTPKRAQSITVSVVAVDPETARTALASDVNRHLMFRYGSLFASSFISGYGKAIASQGTTTVSPLTGTTTTSTPPLDNAQIFKQALGELGTQWGQAVKPYFSTPYTVTVDKGTSVGLLFLSDVDASEES